VKQTRGMGRVYLRGETWWIQFSVNGQRHRESSNSPDRADAVRLLKRRLHETQVGKPMGVGHRTTLGDLLAMVVADYEVNGRRSIKRVRIAVNRLKEFFDSDCKTEDLTVDRITAFKAARLEQVSAGCVNYECAILRRAFTLAVEAGKVAVAPKIKMLHFNNARQGFFEREQFEAVLRHLPDYLKSVVQCAYLTGWRTQSELLTRLWKHVDFDNGWLRLEVGETKNDEGREFPMLPELRTILEAQREHVSRLERVLGRVIPHVFVHDDGRPIGPGYRNAWIKACRRAGLPGKLIHDFRRSAVRNLERAGISRSASMKMTGHKTESVFRRYAITDSAVLQEAGEKLSKWHRLGN